MLRKRLPGLIFICLFVILIGGCSVPLSNKVREQASKGLSLAEVISDPAAYRGKTVIWGGVITRIVIHDDRTDIFIRETPLDFKGKPKDSDSSGGFFIARTPKKLDPEKFKEGSRITLAGEIAGQELGTYAKEPYAYPVLDIKESYLWETGFPTVRWEKEGGKFPFNRRDIYSPEDDYFFPAR